jgi:SAM-dependent methyltransferase
MLREYLKAPIDRVSRTLRWRLGLRVAAPALEVGTDSSLAGYYDGRVTDCAFLLDPAHYEFPRARWVTERVAGGRLLEVGCGNGGMTRLLAPRVDELLALDVSTPSLDQVVALGLANVRTAKGLVEQFDPGATFRWIVLSEVLEHLRRPREVVERLIGWLEPGGTLLVTTPNGHWESNEHLHEFDLSGFSRLFLGGLAETVTTGYLRDGENRRRWLVAEVFKARYSPSPDPFTDRATTSRKRNQRRLTQE